MEKKTMTKIWNRAVTVEVVKGDVIPGSHGNTMKLKERL